MFDLVDVIWQGRDSILIAGPFDACLVPKLAGLIKCAIDFIPIIYLRTCSHLPSFSLSFFLSFFRLIRFKFSLSLSLSEADSIHPAGNHQLLASWPPRDRRSTFAFILCFLPHRMRLGQGQDPGQPASQLLYQHIK